jgi:type II secretory ATPase GspE/PulE/Tfp pilus assembly ATPase PilB-like protein
MSGETRPVRLSDFQPLPTGKDQYPPEFIQYNQVVKLRETPTEIQIGHVAETMEDLLDQLEHYHEGRKTRFHLLDKKDFSIFLAELFSQRDPGSTDGKPAGDPGDSESLDKLAGNAPIINLVNSIIMDALEKRASDIHIESFTDNALVRFRIDGTLIVVRELGKEDFPAVSSRLKIMANLNIVESRRPQDGRLSVNYNKDMIDIRISIVPIVRGESIVMRILNRSRSSFLTLEDLGFEPNDLTGLRSLYRNPNGLILVTGPTGSGKTTTLNAVLAEINTSDRKIVTIEDPVEFVIDGVDQIQTQEAIGLTFDTLLRRVLRQDPDIIMIGEIRDKTTAELAVRAALTGHLVFATLHTNDAVSVINRLTNMGVPDYLLAAVLRGVLSQRLVRRLCPRCRQPVQESAALKKFRKTHSLADTVLYRPGQCDKCDNTGYRGRIALLEWFRQTDSLETLILRQGSVPEMRAELIKSGMITFTDDGIRKLLAGIISPEDFERTVFG